MTVFPLGQVKVISRLSSVACAISKHTFTIWLPLIVDGVIPDTAIVEFIPVALLFGIAVAVLFEKVN